MAKPRDPFDVTLTPAQKTALGQWLSVELTNAIAARSANESEVEYWHALYEQARTRGASDLPWPDAADLTSFIACEKADAIHARLMRTIWVNPVWTVEGWGDAADRAPFVEEAHQYWAEEERLQSVLDKLALTALIEPRGLLEVYESSQTRTSRKTIRAKPKRDPETGGLLFDDAGAAMPETNPDGAFAEASAEEASIEQVVDHTDVIRTGPQYRVLPYRDSLILPGHARDKDEIWGYAKRIFPRLTDLQAKAKTGAYDQEAVDRLTAAEERETTPSLDRANQGIAPQYSLTAEKELWETLVLVDLNAIMELRGQQKVRGLEGARWYLATVHVGQQVILRCQHDDFERSRYVPFILFPRPDRVTEGFSLIGHKLVTTIEEHTAYRNMGADATNKAVNAPILKLQGALWDEDEQPMGPKVVITVRDPREITFPQIPDMPQSIALSITRAEAAAERLAGVNDIASGQVAQESRTLGEVQMATEQSFVRMDLIVRRFQEAMEDLAQIRHAIYKRMLQEKPDGIDAPQSVIVGAEGRGCTIDEYLPDGKITAALLDGAFRFRPYGSVETADPAKRRADALGFAEFVPKFAQMYPALAPQLTSPQAGRAILRQVLQAFRQQNTQAFLGSPSQDLMGAGGVPGQMPGMPAPTGMPGQPPAGAAPPMPGMPPPAGGNPQVQQLAQMLAQKFGPPPAFLQGGPPMAPAPPGVQ